MKYKGIIFDFNGVLLWDTEWHTEAWQVAAQELRGAPMSDEELANHHGRTNKEFLRYLVGENLEKKDVAEKAEFKENLYRNIAIAQGEKFALSPGAKGLLDLILRQNIPHAIATSSPWSNTDFFIQRLNLYHWFEPDKIIFDDGTVPGKPAPDLYLRAADRLGLPASGCVIIEDARSGIQAAKNARAGKIIGLGPKKRHEELRLWGADQTVENLGKLSLEDF